MFYVYDFFYANRNWKKFYLFIFLNHVFNYTKKRQKSVVIFLFFPYKTVQKNFFLLLLNAFLGFKVRFK